LVQAAVRTAADGLQNSADYDDDNDNKPDKDSGNGKVAAASDYPDT